MSKSKSDQVHLVLNKQGFMVFAMIGVLLLLTLTIIGGGVFLYQLDQDMLAKMEQKKMIQPTLFYSQTPSWKIGDAIPLQELQHQLQAGFRERDSESSLFPGDYRWLDRLSCHSLFDEGAPELGESDRCLQIYWPASAGEEFKAPLLETVWLSGESSQIRGVYQGTEYTPREEFVTPPQVVAQYLGGDPVLYNEYPLNKIPVNCMNAVMAIEDAKFLEHRGVSPLGILRAIVVNSLKGRKAQGGSTLTQQLVKNYFLTPEKTLKRKIVEFFMALLIEARFDKDLILETYLNIIYMGQQGPYQVRGYGAAAQHYFQKELTDLNLAQCGLLAAIVNSPGQFDPFRHPDKAKERRDFVLHKMREQKMISDFDQKEAINAPLPQDENIQLYSTLPYFLQAVVDQAKKLGYEDLEGHQIFTSLDLSLQEAAQKAVQKNLDDIESQKPKIKKIKQTKKINLEGALASVDVSTGKVRAFVGGRSFRTTQFNRLLQSKRQVGSTFKPFVYLAAIESGGDEINPISELRDSPFTYEYGRQKWTPHNYDETYFGKVPLYFGLKESLNLATSQLALSIGLNKVVSTAHRLGIQTNLKEVPSLSLGALELPPLELLQAYLTLARFGERLDLTFIEFIEDRSGNIVWNSSQRAKTQALDSASVQVLVGMLKQTALTGTARRIKDSGFGPIVAGKTGTTNDFKDSWFVGFTPDILTLVWTGYDDNTSSGLTGASGALPAWLDYMSVATKLQNPREFPWTDEVESRTIPISDLISKGFWMNKTSKEPDEIQLIFKK